MDGWMVERRMCLCVLQGVCPLLCDFANGFAISWTDRCLKELRGGGYVQMLPRQRTTVLYFTLSFHENGKSGRGAFALVGAIT